MCKIVEWFMLILFIVGSIYDWRKREIPILLLVVMSAVTAITVFVSDGVNLALRIVGGLMGFVFLFISKCTKEAIGYADSWIILLLGVQLGFRRAIQLLFGASLLAAIFSLFLIFICRWKRRATLPFIPFLTISYLGVMVL